MPSEVFAVARLLFFVLFFVLCCFFWTNFPSSEFPLLPYSHVAVLLIINVQLKYLFAEVYIDIF